MIERTYTLLCPFGGLGAGALGFLEAETRIFETKARFKLLGGIDFDAAACADFEYLTGVPEWCADVWEVKAEELRARFGEKAPDVVFMSPPCKGASGLLSEKQAKSAKYRKLNQLALQWVKIMIEAWADAPPRLVLFENVPRIVTRAKRVLGAVKAHLRRAGYLLHDGFHDCGAIGGLAQHRRRYLLVARHKSSVSSLLYQPVSKRVRACGEVLEPLPMPNDPAAGPMHKLPAIGWLNWVRLALIPAGGDWRDLPGVLDDGEERRAKFKRHAVEAWTEATGTIGGSGSNGVANVADPRPTKKRGAALSNDPPALAPKGLATRSPDHEAGADLAQDRHPDAGGWFRGTYGVGEWTAPAATVTGAAAASRGRFAVADPRVRHKGSMGVLPWDKASGTVTGESYPSNGSNAVADPRGAALGCSPRAGAYGVLPWDGPAGAVTGTARIDHDSPAAVSDPRVGAALGPGEGVTWHKGKHGVGDWSKPSRSVIGGPSNGASSVADPRAPQWLGTTLRLVPWGPPTGETPRAIPQDGNPNMHEGKYEVRGWEEPTGTVTGATRPGSGSQGVADPRVKVSDTWDRGACLGVVPFDRPLGTITAGTMPGQGAYSVADTRIERAALVGVIPLEDARRTIVGELPTPFAAVDPSSDGPPVMVVERVDKAPPAAPVILAADGTWHRPLTTLELAVLQGLPAVVHGAPLLLSGSSSSDWRERIGNAVPVQAATAIAEQMLITLLSSDLQAFSLSSGGGVWVRPETELREDA